jgi:hypothetical protein
MTGEAPYRELDTKKKRSYAVALGDSYLVSLTSGQLVRMIQLMGEGVLIYNCLERTK